MIDRRHFFLAGLASALLVGCSQSGPVQLAPNSVLYVVRHADREGENLSDKGIRRAHSLVTALEGMPLDAIYSPGIQRNLDTAAPISQARALPVQRRAPEAPTHRLSRESAGRSVLWVGNKGNIRTIWEDLSLPAPVPLEYGDLAIIRSDSNGQVTVERRVFEAI